jgi:hypothetical protein
MTVADLHIPEPPDGADPQTAADFQHRDADGSSLDGTAGNPPLLAAGKGVGSGVVLVVDNGMVHGSTAMRLGDSAGSLPWYGSGIGPATAGREAREGLETRPSLERHDVVAGFAGTVQAGQVSSDSAGQSSGVTTNFFGAALSASGSETADASQPVAPLVPWQPAGQPAGERGAPLLVPPRPYTPPHLLENDIDALRLPAALDVRLFSDDAVFAALEGSESSWTGAAALALAFGMPSSLRQTEERGKERSSCRRRTADR